MKCPKCDYLGFESSDRCRNCGYEFSLLQSASAPFVDPPLSPAGFEPLIPSPDSQAHARLALDLDQIIGVPWAPPQDLPLFNADGDDGIPLINQSSRPRAPLGVRRATPEIPRARVPAARPHEETLFQPPPASTVAAPGATGEPAGPTSRIVAALVDATLLLTLDAAVLYFTLRLCGLTVSETAQLPAAPLLAFFVLLDGGYLVAFTAVGGQSIGKMALGIKVVGEEDRPVPVGRAALRTLAYFLSVLPLGAGFLPGVLGADRLALHDRLARTRVVRPSSV
jgi:uncharacterized RDD family membrane protein YckC